MKPIKIIKKTSLILIVSFLSACSSDSATSPPLTQSQCLEQNGLWVNNQCIIQSSQCDDGMIFLNDMCITYEQACIDNGMVWTGDECVEDYFAQSFEDYAGEWIASESAIEEENGNILTGGPATLTLEYNSTYNTWRLSASFSYGGNTGAAFLSRNSFQVLSNGNLRVECYSGGTQYKIIGNWTAERLSITKLYDINCTYYDEQLTMTRLPGGTIFVEADDNYYQDSKSATATFSLNN